ncbi:ROK family protein [Paenibacillus campi]|uniref:ROK family protein n=1 Tax=Paenibacillus campi TaxID=3106031 RepID=UPI002AFE6B0F|nr:ROK family protein [Paenibacillus sp. SGZ-1014]
MKQSTAQPVTGFSGSGYTAGIDIGGTKTLILITDSSGQVIARSKKPTVQTEQAEAFVAAVFAQLDEVLYEAGLVRDRLNGIGIGFPGAVNTATGIIHHVPALPLDGANLLELIRPHYSGALYLDNDVNMAALGECWQGAGTGSTQMVMVTIGTGVGGAMILNGELHRGASYTAGEISYFVVDYQPEETSGTISSLEFGRYESLASGTGIGEHARRWLRQHEGQSGAQLIAQAGSLEQVQAVHVLQLAAAGDADAQAIMQAPLGYIAAGLANIISLLNPERIVVGGGVSESGYYMSELKRRVGQFTPIEAQLVPALLGNEAGALGAIYGVLHTLQLHTLAKR